MSGRGPYQSKRTQTRRRLLRAGLAVVAEGGTGALNVARVAGAADVVPGTFYNYFDGRDDLLAALVDVSASALELQAGALETAGDEPAARLAAMAAQLLGTVERDPLAVRAFVALVADVPAFEDRARELVASTLEAGRAAGRFALEAGAATADAVLAVAVQAARSRLAGRTGAGDDRSTIRLILRLVGLPEGEVDATLAALRS